ncbi:hypothetical protein OAT16_09795 [Prolixibacteraceae bacterium]|nr:hypothetical protein [Prolixibacteraceae bacterium]
MKNLHEKEEQLLKEFQEHYKQFNEETILCFDGLCYNGELYNEDKTSHSGDEEQLWQDAKRKILFVTKDTNDNPEEDYREWPWKTITHRHFKTIFAWLKGLSKLDKDHYPSLDEAYQNYDASLPLAIINIKKASGESSVPDKTLIEYAERDQKLIKKQIREILQPNIIVCCHAGGIITELMQELIYPDYHFEDINHWCVYCKEHNLLLIDSYHPGAREANETKYDGMMEGVQEFIKKVETPIF